MSLDATRQELAELLHRSLDGDLDDAQREHLTQRISGDQEAIRLYLELIATHVTLTWNSGGHEILGQKTKQAQLVASQLQPNLHDDPSEQALKLLLEIEPDELTPVDLEEKRLHAEQILQANRKAPGHARRDVGPSPRVIIIPRSLAYSGVAALVMLCIWMAWSLMSPAEERTDSPRPEPLADHSGSPIAPAPPPDPGGEAPVFVAELVRSHDAQWSGKAPLPGADLAVGPMRLNEGYADLKLIDGTRVLVQGPAEFVLVQGNSLELRSGRIVAEVPEQASGFTVATPTGFVIDYGTRFGVEVDHTHVTTAAVFEGVVELKGKASDSVLVLTKRQAAEVDDLGEVDFSPKQLPAEEQFRFVENWEEAERGWRVFGAIRTPEAERLSLDLGGYESNAFISLIPERVGHQLETTLHAVLPRGDLLAPPAVEIDEGQRVDTYLVHFDVVGQSEGVIERNAKIIFDRPILGVLLDGSSVVATNRSLGRADVLYPTLFDEMGVDPFQDKVSISPDGRVLTMQLLCSRSIDQMRVIVASE